MRILAASAALCLFGFVAAVAYEIWLHRVEVVADVAEVFISPEPADAVLAAMPATERPAYRHSIVLGGVYSRNEVADAMRKDEVVAAHYEHVDPATLHPKTVPAARAVYVSYRIGDRVFWTRNRVRLAAGETVLTDGHTEIRARCGNLVSDHARQPVADHEPPVTALDEMQAETGSSTTAGVRNPEGGVNDVPEGPMLGSGLAAGAVPSPDVQGMPGMPGSPGSQGAQGAPMWAGGAGGGIPSGGSRAGIAGSPFAPPLGSSERTGRGHEGDGKGNDDNQSSTGDGTNHGGSNGDESTGGGSNGGGSNGGGSHGGGHDDPHHPINPPTTTTNNLVVTTTGGFEGDVSTVPEPATMTLLALGAIGAAVRRVRSRR